MTFSLYNRFRDLEKVRVDSSAIEGFLGAASTDGVLRTSSPLSYTDGGDFITLGFTASSVKLDDLGTPDDNTDLDFSTTLHGLVPKGTNVGDFLKDDGTWSSVAAGADVKVGIDVGATAGFLGAAIGDGVLRFTTNEFTLVDGGDFVTLSLADHATARTALGLAIGTDVLAEQTIGIADNNLLEVDSADAADDEYARFTANGLEGRTPTELMTDLPAATSSAAGKSELAIASEVNTGTDTGRTVTPDALAGSYAGTKTVAIKVIDDGTALTTGDGKTHWTVPIELNGMDLVTVGAHVYTNSSSGTPTFQIHNLTDTSDMLSTVITIDINEPDSSTAATPPVIDGTEDDVVTGDVLRFDCDVAGTGTAGMEIRLGFRLP
ncbi:MAG: hypothetical protein V3V81_08100 [Candidatus Bathyarchaeia archaeon]